jgi:methionine-rich copper-binding protein CopC
MIRLLVIASLFMATPSMACLEHSHPEQGSVVHINDNRVELEFTDAVDIATVAATVTDEQGRKVSTGELKRGDDNKTVFVMLRPQDPRGRTGYEAGLYVVEWRVGHGDVEHSGKFTFRVHKH